MSQSVFESRIGANYSDEQKAFLSKIMPKGEITDEDIADTEYLLLETALKMHLNKGISKYRPDDFVLGGRFMTLDDFASAFVIYGNDEVDFARQFPVKNIDVNIFDIAYRSLITASEVGQRYSGSVGLPNEVLEAMSQMGMEIDFEAVETTASLLWLEFLITVYNITGDFAKSLKVLERTITDIIDKTSSDKIPLTLIHSYIVMHEFDHMNDKLPSKRAVFETNPTLAKSYCYSYLNELEKEKNGELDSYIKTLS